VKTGVRLRARFSYALGVFGLGIGLRSTTATSKAVHIFNDPGLDVPRFDRGPG